MDKQEFNTQHLGLTEKELRDYFSIQIAIHSEPAHQPAYPSIPNNPIDRQLQHTENLIAHYTKEKYRLKMLSGLILLMRERGWEEFDVSDELGINRDINKYCSFIGTHNEYNDFIKKLEQHER